MASGKTGIPVSFDKIQKSFGPVRVLEELNLQVEPGEFLVLLGASGSGKTTALRILCGLETASAGRVRIGDRDVTDILPKYRDISMVFQSYALYPHMSVFENIGFALENQGLSRGEIKKKVEHVGEMLQLTSYLTRLPKALSGGQRQRVAIGRAIVRGAKVFLFDEPLSNLDAALRVQMRMEIAKLKRDLPNTTMVYVTHDQVEAMTMADRIVVMNKGLVQQCADPMTIYDKPANRFVASFIGSPPINMMEGLVVKQGRKYFFDEGKFQVRIIDEMAARFAKYEGKRVAMGIRAEDIYDKLFASEASPENTVRAICEVVEPLGSEVYLYLNTGKHNFIARVGAHDRPDVNRDMDVVLDMTKVHFFDSQTEEAII